MTTIIQFELTLALALLLCNVALAQKANPGNPSVPKGWSFSFPDGNADTGKQLFVKMECYACHTLKLPKESLAAKPGKGGAGADRLCRPTERVPGVVDHQSAHSGSGTWIHG